MSSLSIVGQATVAVLQIPSKFENRPAYFADYTASSNDLLKILNGRGDKEEWKPAHIPLDGFFEHAKKNWDGDTAAGVEDRLNSTAYHILGTYGLFEEGNRYGADFSGRVEEGFGVSVEEFESMLRQAIDE